MRKQREHEMKFRIERQQLRHDEKFAMQRIEDQDRLEQVLKNVYGTNEQLQSNRFAENQNVSENDIATKEEDLSKTIDGATTPSTGKGHIKGASELT